MYQVKNHNGTLLGEFTSKVAAEAEATKYRTHTGNPAHVERTSEPTTLNIDEMAQNALDAACASIQEALGVATGDLAGMFFSGEAGERVLDVFKSYIRLEIESK
jgi:hypothetical protein